MCHEYLMISIVQKGEKSGNHNKMPWFLSSLPSASLSSGLSFLLWVLLCADDTHCSQMRWQHILSAGDDEEVPSGVKERRRRNHTDRRSKMAREDKLRKVVAGAPRAVWEEVLTFSTAWNKWGRFLSHHHQLKFSKETISVGKTSLNQAILAAFLQLSKC